VVLWLDRFADVTRVRPRGWLTDWHVYAAGARDLLAGTLYHVPLVSDYPIPVDAFNLPPASAVTPIPFLLLPDSVAGPLFIVLNLACVAGASVTARVVNVPHPWFWSGAAFFAYTLSGWSQAAFLGNNTPMVLLFVAAAIAAHLASRTTLSGVLLGIAIASKLWPAALLVPLARERAWATLGWAVGTAAVIMVVLLAWLGGPDAVRPMISAFAIDIEPNPRQVLLGLTWLRVHTDWWPEWGGYAVAALLLLIPARGLTGYGLAVLAGLAAIPNVWWHYLSTLAFGVVLLAAGLARRYRERTVTADAHRTASPPSLAGTERAADSELGS
jgi:hypothetical protein